MKKRYAFTMIEILTALSIVVVLSVICLSTLKPNTQNSKIHLYATIRNLMRANSWIYDNLETFNGANVGTNDWYCMQLEDILSAKTSNCSTSASSTTANLAFSTGVEIYGLASAWNLPYAGAIYQYKNILIDVNGAKGPNKIWIDKFPMRIYRGSNYDGVIAPANCGTSDKVYNETTGALVSMAVASPYCSGNVKYANDASVLSYDILRGTNEDDTSKAMVVALSQSPMLADCGAYGGVGIYSKSECVSAGLKLYPECAQTDTCYKCEETANICPPGSTNQASCLTLAQSKNPGDLPCNAIIHKPNAGLSFVVESVIGDFDDGY